MFYSVVIGLFLLLASLQGPERAPEPILGNQSDNRAAELKCLGRLEERARPFAERLKERIKLDLKEKVPEEYIEAIFCKEDLSFSPETMLRSLTWKEAKLPYHQFLELERLMRAKAFLEEKQELLEEIERHFKVDKEVITAIFLVETDLGRKTGSHSVLNTFFSLALTGDEELFRTYVEKQPEIDFNNETVRKRWERRASWAYRELLHFLEISYKNSWDPFAIKGSIFGAFGYPQFVPKSYVLYGYDWDGDGVVDLFSLPDALASIANYLQKEGYRQDGDYAHKKRIIMKYNISEPYAETVLGIAEALKKNLILPPDVQGRN